MIYCSLIIPFKSTRIDNLYQTLRFFALEDIAKNTELILVCQDSFDVGQINGFYSTKILNLNSHQYCRSKMCNIGVSNSNSDNLILLDSDRILKKGYFTKVVSCLEKDSCVTTRNLWKAYGPLSDEEIASGSYQAIMDHRSLKNTMQRKSMFSGNTVLKKDLYVRAGMMDESYIGYGYQDIDFTRRMMMMKKKMIYLEDKELHLWHKRDNVKLENHETIMNAFKYCKKWNLKPDDELVWFGEDIGINVYDNLNFQIDPDNFMI